MFYFNPRAQTRITIPRGKQRASNYKAKTTVTSNDGGG